MHGARAARTRYAGRLLLALTFCVGGVGCKSRAERDLAEETAAFGPVVRALRDAPHDAKGPWLERLRALSCSHPRVCEIQRVCLDAYSLHDAATQATRSLRDRLAAGEPIDDGVMKAVLDTSEADLERARAGMDRCLELETALIVDVR